MPQPPIWLAISGLLAVVSSMKFLALLLTSLMAVVPIGLAGLTFEKTLIEFHPKLDTAQVTADFPFRNDTDKPVRIAKYDAACSCMEVGVSGGKLDYAPGEAGVIRAVFKLAGYHGTVDRVIALWLENDPIEAPSSQLTLRAHIPQLIKMEPKTLTWDLNQAPNPQTISVEMDSKTKIHILGTRSSADNFTLEVQTLEAGKRYQIIVTPKNTATQSIAAFHIETDCEVDSQRVHTAFGVVRNPQRQP